MRVHAFVGRSATGCTWWCGCPWNCCSTSICPNAAPATSTWRKSTPHCRPSRRRERTSNSSTTARLSPGAPRASPRPRTARSRATNGRWRHPRPSCRSGGCLLEPGLLRRPPRVPDPLADSAFAIDFHRPGAAGAAQARSALHDPDGAVRAFDILTGSGEVALDPRWHQAAWTLRQSGFDHILDGPTTCLFLLCLVVPFRRIGWTLVGRDHGVHGWRIRSRSLQPPTAGCRSAPGSRRWSKS